MADFITDAARPGNGSPSIRTVLRLLAAAWRRERVLFRTGLFCIVLGLAGGVAMVAHGRFVAPEGDLAKPIAFDVALGIYVLTIAPLIPLAGFSTRFLGRWRAAQVVMALGSVAIANIQTYRGIDPRFARSGAPIDHLAAMLFGFLALGGSVSFLMLAVPLFRRRADAEEELLSLGVRYGAVAAMIGYATGLWMIVIGGARSGASGDILPLHALGFHGLQAVPVIALLLGWGRMPFPSAHRWVHVAGSAWLGACAVLAWQALLGRPVLELSPASVVALAALLVWGLITARAAAAWLRCP